MEQLEMNQFKFEEVRVNYNWVERTKFEISKRKRLNKKRTLVCKKNKRGRIYKRKVNYVSAMNILKRVTVELVATMNMTKNVISMKELNEKFKSVIESKEERRTEND
jgi:hypothetical protein